MRKIISVFQRNYETDRLIRDEVAPGAEWVLAGEGVATRKFDGTCCMIRKGILFKRYEVNPSRKAPPNFEAATDLDGITGKLQGWLPVGNGPEDKWHREAWDYGTDWHGEPLRDGTYELLGPKVQGNPDGATTRVLLRHGSVQCQPQPPRDFAGIREYLRTRDVEGIVFHHPDGRMAKVKKKDYGLPRKPEMAQLITGI
jgi:hypothetical protein